MSLEALQNEIVSRLSADEYFVDVSVIGERHEDIENEITRALSRMTTKGGKIGAVVLVGGFEFGVPKPNLPGPDWSDGTVLVTAIETVLFNRGASGTGKAAADIAVRAGQVLHHYRPVGLAQTLYVHADGLRKVEDTKPGDVAYVVPIRINPKLSAPVKLPAPTVAPAAGAAPQTVTLTCAGATAIYYTLDDTYPSSGNANATLYSGPVTVAAAANLRAVGYALGKIASDAEIGIYT